MFVRVTSYVVVGFIVIPLLVVMLAALTTTSYIAVPPQGITGRWFIDALTNDDFRDGAIVSFIVAAITAMLTTALALSFVWAVERYRFPGRNVVTTLSLAPLTVPIIVLAIGLLFVMTEVGVAGTITGLVIGHTVISFPYAVRAIASSIAGLDQDVERAASILGASPVRVLMRVSLPLIAPGLTAAALFAFLVSYNNVTISIFLAGPTTQTLPLVIFNETYTSVSPSLAAMATLLVAATVALVAVLDRKLGVYSALSRGRAL